MEAAVELTGRASVQVLPTQLEQLYDMDKVDEEALFRIADEIRNAQANNEADMDAAISTPRPPALPEDHMQAVVHLIRTRPKEHRSNPPTPKRKASEIAEHSAELPFSDAQKERKKKASAGSSYETLTSSLSSSSIAFKVPQMIRFPDAVTPTGSSASIRRSFKIGSKGQLVPFPFLLLPPELRNRIYDMLLTIREPIEVDPTRQTASIRNGKFAKCKTVKARRNFKTIFLEIIQTSKQVHQEATTVLYGNNIFKFRSDHKAGYRDPKNMLPERYLKLLRRVKVSVISREADNGQDQWVADLLKNTFSRDKTRLDTFELTWFGWKKFRLTKDGVLCQALLTLDVEKVLSVKLTGDTRMATDMLKELQEHVRARKVEIVRPVFEVLKEGKTVEASDDE